MKRQIKMVQKTKSVEWRSQCERNPRSAEMNLVLVEAERNTKHVTVKRIKIVVNENESAHRAHYFEAGHDGVGHKKAM
jgi:hypothetical protein